MTCIITKIKRMTKYYLTIELRIYVTLNGNNKMKSRNMKTKRYSNQGRSILSDCTQTASNGNQEYKYSKYDGCPWNCI